MTLVDIPTEGRIERISERALRPIIKNLNKRIDLLQIEIIKIIDKIQMMEKKAV